MRQDEAETIAIRALGWIAAEEGLFEVFLDATGCDAGEVRARAADPDFQGAVLDFLLLSDQHVTGFCDAAGLAYDIPLRARAALPGGGAPDWT